MRRQGDGSAKLWCVLPVEVGLGQGGGGEVWCRMYGALVPKNTIVGGGVPKAP